MFLAFLVVLAARLRTGAGRERCTNVSVLNGASMYQCSTVPFQDAINLFIHCLPESLGKDGGGDSLQRVKSRLTTGCLLCKSGLASLLCFILVYCALHPPGARYVASSDRERNTNYLGPAPLDEMAR